MASALSCTICYDSYEESSDICSAKCGHVFHLKCLQQWITQSNTCPLCNASNPQPHRLYLDVGGINETLVSNSTQADGIDNTVIVKGVKPNQVTTPLLTLIQRLIGVMQVPITNKDIKDISKHGPQGHLLIHVTFKMKYHMELFLKQKHKLKKNPEMSQIRIHELLNSETEALFQYTHKLKNADYKIIYVENKKVYVKKHQHSQPINIRTRDDVDTLCLQHKNNRKATSTSTIQRNNELRPTNNIQRTSNNISESTEALYIYSQTLTPYGYQVFIKNNQVFAKHFNSLQTIRISSRSQVDDLYVDLFDLFESEPYIRENPTHNTEKNDTCNIL